MPCGFVEYPAYLAVAFLRGSVNAYPKRIFKFTAVVNICLASTKIP